MAPGDYGMASLTEPPIRFRSAIFISPSVKIVFFWLTLPSLLVRLSNHSLYSGPPADIMGSISLIMGGDTICRRFYGQLGRSSGDCCQTYSSVAGNVTGTFDSF